MPHDDIIRAWKDEEYRNSLSEEQRAQLPENPAGLIELGDADMQSVAGGLEVFPTTFLRCPTLTIGCTNTIRSTIRLFGKWRC